MSGLLKAIGFSRKQLLLLRKYGAADEQAGAGQLDAWLEQLAAQHQEDPAIERAAGFARRDPEVTVAKPHEHS